MLYFINFKQYFLFGQLFYLTFIIITVIPLTKNAIYGEFVRLTSLFMKSIFGLNKSVFDYMDHSTEYTLVPNYNLTTKNISMNTKSIHTTQLT